MGLSCPLSLWKVGGLYAAKNRNRRPYKEPSSTNNHPTEENLKKPLRLVECLTFLMISTCRQATSVSGQKKKAKLQLHHWNYIAKFFSRRARAIGFTKKWNLRMKTQAVQQETNTKQTTKNQHPKATTMTA